MSQGDGVKDLFIIILTRWTKETKTLSASHLVPKLLGRSVAAMVPSRSPQQQSCVGGGACMGEENSAKAVAHNTG